MTLDSTDTEAERMTAQQQAGTVAIWRSVWLPGSETFVRDHVVGLRRWRPVLLGLRAQDGGFGLVPDAAPFTRSRVGVLATKVARRLGFPLVYDRVIRRERPALVHAHFGTGAVDALPIARRHGLPLVVTFHGHDVTQAVEDAGAEKYLARLHEVFAYATRLLAVSEYIADRLRELGAPEEKIEVRHLGIPVPEHLPDPASGRQGIVFVGRLVEKKGVADLLDAVALLPSELIADHPVTIIGDGPLRAELEARAASVTAATGTRITFTGHRRPDEVAEALAGARVFVGPSRPSEQGDAEGFGLTFIEANRAGAPVVAYRSAGVTEAVVDSVTGYLVEVADVPALAERMRLLLDDPALAARLGAAGQQRVRDDFDIVRKHAALEELYDEIARTATTRHRAP